MPPPPPPLHTENGQLMCNADQMTRSSMIQTLVLHALCKISQNTSFLVHVFPYKDRIFDPYTRKYGSEKTRILAYFTP